VSAEQAWPAGPEDGAGAEIMRLLEAAFAPVEPPVGMVEELEAKLASVGAAALETLEELADWEMEAIRDPRNWVRPAVALTAGTAAGAALVVLRLRRSRSRRAPGLRGIAGQGGRSLLGAVSSARDHLPERRH
jgi:hypothetical protein